MLALFDKNTKPPVSITNFKCLYSETCLQPLALLPVSDEEVSKIKYILYEKISCILSMIKKFVF